ncbi:TPA: hypothetical protein ACM9EF_004797, partial [Escherichia coli]
MVVIEQLTQLFHSIVQFFRIGKNRLRITFVQRMNKILLWPASFFLVRFPGLQACQTQRRQALFFSSLPRFLRRYRIM